MCIGNGECSYYVYISCWKVIIRCLPGCMKNLSYEYFLAVVHVRSAFIHQHTLCFMSFRLHCSKPDEVGRTGNCSTFQQCFFHCGNAQALIFGFSPWRSSFLLTELQLCKSCLQTIGFVSVLWIGNSARLEGWNCTAARMGRSWQELLFFTALLIGLFAGPFYTQAIECEFTWFPLKHCWGERLCYLLTRFIACSFLILAE